MIINNLASPNNSLYVIGGEILLAFRYVNKYYVDPIELYHILNRMNSSISLTYFYLALDWLYLVNVIEQTDSGDLKLCNS
jgi:hypothetical protein